MLLNIGAMLGAKLNAHIVKNSFRLAITKWIKKRRMIITIEEAITIDEAIQYLYEIANKGGDERDEEYLQLANQLAKWLEELKRHRQFRVNKDIKNPLANLSGYVCHHCDHKDEYIIEYEDTGLTPKQIEQMKRENAELKQLLKLAIEHLGIDGTICDRCNKLHTDECDPVADCSCYEWRYFDKAKGLIEDGSN
ncbi:MAG: hypothetical protein ACI4JQ_02100 [Ruminococcus sp.]